MLESAGDRSRGARAPMRSSSVLVGWARAASILAALLSIAAMGYVGGELAGVGLDVHELSWVPTTPRALAPRGDSCGRARASQSRKTELLAMVAPSTRAGT